MQRTTRRAAAALTISLALVAAACGGDDGDSADETTTTAAATTTTAAATTTTAGGTTTTAAGEGSADGVPKAECAGEPDTSLDAELGDGAGEIAQRLACLAEKPLKAEGEPIVIGVMNPKGDPAGSFPEYESGVNAAVKLINEKLGGIGSDPVNGKPGRPIKVDICSVAINPADTQRCANEIAGKDPFSVLTSIIFFGNHYPVFQAAGLPTFTTSPVTIADFTTPGIYAIGAGGGCVGNHTGLVEYVINDLGARRVAVPWADTPPGVVCYHDLEKKPLNVLKGVTPGPGVTKTFPEIEHIGIPIKPATPDLTPQVTQVLDFKPDAIIFSAQAADCWNFVGTLGRTGWTNDQIPLVLSGACLDLPKMKEVGDLAKGITIIGGPPVAIPELNKGLIRLESEAYVQAMKDGGVEQDTVKGFGTAGFMGTMNMWQLMSAYAAEKGTLDIDRDGFGTFVAATKNRHAFGGTPLGCAEAVAPYVSICAAKVTAQQWDGSTFSVKRANFSGAYLVAGTELDTGS